MVEMASKRHMSLAAIAVISVAGAATIISTTGVLTTCSPPTGGDAVVYNKDMTDWWEDMIESLGGESRAVWTEPGWSDDMWVEIEDMGSDTYQISLFLPTVSGAPIVYTITETENGYDKYGPAMPDGSMDCRTYVKTAEDASRKAGA